MLARFGLLTGLTILVPFLADLLLTPALMSLAVGRGRRAVAWEGVTEGTP